MTCAVLVSVVIFLPSPLSFSSVSVFSPFSSLLSLSPVSFPLFLTFFSFLREDCLTYLTCSELHCDPSPSHLKSLSLSSLLHVFLFSRTFFFHLLVISCPFLKTFFSKIIFAARPAGGGPSGLFLLHHRYFN